MKKLFVLMLGVFAAAPFARSAAVVIPPEFALPESAIDTSKPGFRVRPYRIASTLPGNLAAVETMLLGNLGANTADLSGADTDGYYGVDTVVNWNIASPVSVDGLAPSDPYPGISSGAENFAVEVLTYVQFPAAGTYKLGVNSDDGFSVAASALNPRDRLSAITLGQLDGTRGSADSIFDVSVSKAGYYPIRLVEFQVGGGANVSFFTMVTDDTGTNPVLVNDASNGSALKAYAAAVSTPPFVKSFGHDPAGFTFTVVNETTSLDPATLKVKFNGNPVTVSSSVNGAETVVSYVASPLTPSGSKNAVTVDFADNATPVHTFSYTLNYTEVSYAPIPEAAALDASGVDKTQRGFTYRVHQIDSASKGILAATIASAEKQLAGFTADHDGNLYDNVATPSSDNPDGSYNIDVVNFTTSTTDAGTLTADNGYPDSPFPGSLVNGDNIAIEIIGYLELTPGFYNFAVTSADGFRVSVAETPKSAFATTLGIYDYRRITTETRFGVLVTKAGIYPIRLVAFRQSNMADNGTSTGNLEFYTIKADGTKIAVNDAANADAVKSYRKRTAPFAPYVSYAGPTSFISPFNGADWASKDVIVNVVDGSSDTVVANSVKLSVDGAVVAATPTVGNGFVTLTYRTPEQLQLPRAIHSAAVTYDDSKGGKHSATWSFNRWCNYLLPDPFVFEDFETTDVGPEPQVPTGWIQTNHTGHQKDGFATDDGNSDFYLGFVVIDKPMRTKKDGVSKYMLQEINATVYSDDPVIGTPLMSGHSVYAESDDRQNGPPGQIQYLTTPTYDFSGKTGIVISFNSAYEQNQDNINELEYSIDDGATWLPLFYWLQEGYDSQGVPDIFRDGLGVIDVTRTLTTEYGDVARYTDDQGNLVGGTYGFYVQAPITDALAPYIEGRVNDDGTESKRVEVLRVPLADNQKKVKFRFAQVGTSSWYWGIDNWSVYSVPSLVSGGGDAGTLSIATGADSKTTLSWTGAGSTLQTAPSVLGPWTDAANQANPQTVSSAAGATFFRLKK